MASAKGLCGVWWCVVVVTTCSFLLIVRSRAVAQDKTARGADPGVIPIAARAPVANAAPPQAVLQSPAALLATPRRDDTTLGRRLYNQSLDGSRDDPFNWSIHIYKAKHRLEIYYKNQLFLVYHAVFGRSRWGGGKEWEGDSRTPEGSYLIVAKHRSARFDWFLRLNYPNATDQERFHEMRVEHELGAGTRLGGQIGIHGTDSPVLNNGDVNWTLGCISVDNRDIDDMARLLPIGTLVVINP